MLMARQQVLRIRFMILVVRKAIERIINRFGLECYSVASRDLDSIIGFSSA